MSRARWRYMVNFILLWLMFTRSLTICTHTLSGSITYDTMSSDDPLSNGFDCACACLCARARACMGLILNFCSWGLCTRAPLVSPLRWVSGRRRAYALTVSGWQDHKPKQHCYWAECKVSNRPLQRWNARRQYLMRLAWKRLSLLQGVKLESDSRL